MIDYYCSSRRPMAAAQGSHLLHLWALFEIILLAAIVCDAYTYQQLHRISSTNEKAWRFSTSCSFHCPDRQYRPQISSAFSSRYFVSRSICASSSSETNKNDNNDIDSEKGDNSNRKMRLPADALKLDYDECYYSVLEVNPNASQKDLKKAYYKMVFKYHPDNRETAEEKSLGNIQMMVINGAYRVLKVEATRRAYDEKRARGFFGSAAGIKGSGKNDEDQKRHKQEKLERDNNVRKAEAFQKKQREQQQRQKESSSGRIPNADAAKGSQSPAASRFWTNVPLNIDDEATQTQRSANNNNSRSKEDKTSRKGVLEEEEVEYDGGIFDDDDYYEYESKRRQAEEDAYYRGYSAQSGATATRSSSSSSTSRSSSSNGGGGNEYYYDEEGNMRVRPSRSSQFGEEKSGRRSGASQVRVTGRGDGSVRSLKLYLDSLIAERAELQSSLMQDNRDWGEVTDLREVETRLRDIEKVKLLAIQISDLEDEIEGLEYDRLRAMRGRRGDEWDFSDRDGDNNSGDWWDDYNNRDLYQNDYSSGSGGGGGFRGPGIKTADRYDRGPGKGGWGQQGGDNGSGWRRSRKAGERRNR